MGRNKARSRTVGTLEDDPRHRAAALAAGLACFPPGNAHGVIGVTIGPRRVAGRYLADWTLRLHVRKKQFHPPAKLTAFEYRVGNKRLSITPDVQPVGGSPTANRGTVLEYSGLHAGAAISTHSPTGWRGGVACLLGRPGASHPSYLLTAGHLFAMGSLRAPVYAAADAFSATEEIGQQVANLLDLRPVDLSLVELNHNGVALAIASAGPAPSDIVAAAPLTHGAAFCPTLGDWTPPVPIDDTTGFWFCDSGVRGTFVVQDPIVTHGAISTEGDSGTCLCTDSDTRQLLGSCIGAVDTGSLFQPLAPLMGEIEGIVGLQMTAWRHP